MATIDLHLQPHCTKYLSALAENARNERSRMYKNAIYLHIQQLPAFEEPKYKYAKSMEFPITSQYLRPGVEARYNFLYIPPREMEMIDKALDEHFRLEMMYATKWIIRKMDLREALKTFLHNYGITDDEFDLERAIKWEQRNRDWIDPFRKKTFEKLTADSA
jgi:hypothetical protein